MDVERVQGRGRSTLIPFSEARKHGSEVSHGIAFKMPDVDVGHGCGKETIVGELLAFLSEKIEMKHVQGIWRRNFEYLKSLKVRDERKLTSIPLRHSVWTEERERNRLRMREQEVVGTHQLWCHLERWSWRRLQALTR